MGDVMQALINKAEAQHYVPDYGVLAPMQRARIEEAKQARFESVHEALEEEFKRALVRNPQRLIATPGFDKEHMKLADVVADSFAGASGDADLHELLVVLGMASQAGGQVGLRASALIQKMAKQHADFHAGDAV